MVFTRAEKSFPTLVPLKPATFHAARYMDHSNSLMCEIHCLRNPPKYNEAISSLTCVCVCVCVCVSHSVMSDSATPGTIAFQAPLSMESSRQKYWNGLPFPSPGYLPNPGIEPRFPVLQADFYHLSTGEALPF